MLLEESISEKYFSDLNQFIETEYLTKQIFPPKKDIFKALEILNPKDVRVVIIGQDPYHNSNQAHGLSFSVNKGITQPPSLKNIFKELKSDLNTDIPKHGCLDHWAKQGILLLNTVLTVEAHKPNSHKNIGWETFTDSIISNLNNKFPDIIFVLWGKYAQKKEDLISSKHTIIKSAHPSPFSANKGFFGSKPFSKINKYLRKYNKPPIDWDINDKIQDDLF